MKFTEEQKEEIENSAYDIEVWEAGIEAGCSFENIEEAYNGESPSDEHFVQQLLEDIGDMPTNLPAYIHIDWESTARNVMMDYIEINGHYFRCLQVYPIY